MSEAHPTEREELERQADGARSRLADALAALDRRRHKVFTPARQARRYALPLAGVGVAIVVGFATGEALSRRSRHRREDELRRLGLPIPLDEAAALAQGSMLAQIMRSAAVSLVSVLVGAIARRALARQLLPAPEPAPEPAPVIESAGQVEVLVVTAPAAG